MATTITRYVNTASTAGTQDGTTSTAGNSGTAAFESLQKAITTLKTTYGNLVGDDQILRLVCLGTTTVDNSPVTIASADWTTDATRYLEIVSGVSHRGHYRGPGQNTSYVLAVASSEPCLTISADNVYVTGISLRNAGDVSGAGAGIVVSSTAYIQRCIFINAFESGSSGLCQGIDANLTAGKTLVVANCYFYGWFRSPDQATDAGIHCGSAGTLVLYNDTFINSGNGVLSPHSGVLVKNCAADCAFKGFATGTYMTGSRTNASADTTVPGTNGRTSLGLAWITAANTDTHLPVTSDLLVGWGTQLRTDATFPLTDDIDGFRRDGAWDVGCDQRSPFVIDNQQDFSFTG